MENYYKECVERDKILADLLSSSFEDLEKLNYKQIEKIVFYLKSINSYDDNCENSWTNSDSFNAKLDKLKNSDEQISLQRVARNKIFKSSAFHMLNGLILAFAILLFFTTTWYWGAISFTVFIFLYFKAEQLTVSALLVSKQQDRKYFLNSIRLAKNCTELNWAGFYAMYEGFSEGFLTKEQEVLHDREVDKINRSFRNALYNEEYLDWLRN